MTTSIHLITVGLSLLAQAVAGRRRDAWKSSTHGNYFAASSVDDIQHAIRGDVPAPWNAKVLQDTDCAELFSFTAARMQWPDDEPPRVVLLSSDTPAGLVAAYRVAVDIRRRMGCESPIDLRTFPGDTAISAGPGVTIARVAGLSAEPTQPGETDQAAFDKSAVSLAHVGRALLSFGYTSLTAHLSGGYKPTIPYLITIVEGMAALRHEVDHKAVFTLDHPTVADNTLVELPLRKLPPEPYRALATAVNRKHDLAECPVVPLQGVAWTPARFGPGRQTTNVGRALAHLVPPGEYLN